jgi:hypothetical protein
MRRVVLSPGVSRDAFHDAALAREWRLARVIDPPDRSHPYEEIWLSPDERTAIHLMEDDMVGVTYALLDGERPEDHSAQIEEDLETIGASRATDWLNGAAASERVAAVSHLAVAADPHGADPDALAAYSAALADPDPAVRAAAAIGAAYLVWPELREPLQALAENDPDAEVRRWAGHGGTALERNLQEERP